MEERLIPRRADARQCAGARTQRIYPPDSCLAAGARPGFDSPALLQGFPLEHAPHLPGSRHKRLLKDSVKACNGKVVFTALRLAGRTACKSTCANRRVAAGNRPALCRGQPIGTEGATPSPCATSFPLRSDRTQKALGRWGNAPRGHPPLWGLTTEQAERATVTAGRDRQFSDQWRVEK